MRTKIFISHVGEEADAAVRIKEAIEKDFLGMVQAFVSSDGNSVAAGEQWLTSIDIALRKSALLLILCSPESVTWPWINFEAGAAWVLKKPIVPLCHGGMEPDKLPLPLLLRDGVLLTDPGGLKKLYSRVAAAVACRVPARSFELLAGEFATPNTARRSVGDGQPDAIVVRLEEALNDARFNWRSLERVAAAAGVPEEQAAHLLRGNPTVRFSTGKSKKVIVGLRSRVG